MCFGHPVATAFSQVSASMISVIVLIGVIYICVELLRGRPQPNRKAPGGKPRRRPDYS